MIWIKRDRPVLIFAAVLLIACLVSFPAFASVSGVDGEPEASSQHTESSESGEASQEATAEGETPDDGADLAADADDPTGEAVDEDVPLPSTVGNTGGNLPTTGRPLSMMIATGVTGVALLLAGAIVYRRKKQD